ncbi:MAG: TetR/AcrR family transcriptional regulator [Bacteroidetes bacterium]|nr:TetR/AcrR family transcriptional regulator [Bacteroidota bacterium]MCK6610654.1 TetR/AcrR family transcriptional regulator [Bacteroidia bacterium]
MTNPSSGRREQIIQAAANLFCARGYEASSMRDIATTLNIEAASLYHHIKSKEEILETICFGMAETFLNGIREVNDIYFNAEERLRMAIQNHVRILTSNLSQSTVFLHEWRSLKGEKLIAFKQLRDQYEKGFRTIVQDGMNEDIFGEVDARFAVLSILSSVNWIAEWYREDGAMSSDEIASRISDFVLGGLRKKLVTDLDYKP